VNTAPKIQRTSPKLGQKLRRRLPPAHKEGKSNGWQAAQAKGERQRERKRARAREQKGSKESGELARVATGA